MEKQDAKIELRGEDFQDILGAVPSWILRWGITIIAVVMMILIMGSALFKYPDMVNATMKLTSSQPATSIISKSSGKIQKIFVKDKQFVMTDTYLALIENSADMSDVLYIKQFLSENVWEKDSLVLPRKEINVGNLQSLYSSYYIALSEYIQFRKMNYYPQKIEMTKKRIQQNIEYYHKLLDQREIIEKQLEINKQQYQRDLILKEDKAISDVSFEATYNQYLQGQLSYSNIEMAIESHSMQMNQMSEDLFDTDFQYNSKKESLELQLKSLTMQLQAEIKNWEMSYLLKAPIAGIITFTNYWIENQNIIAGEKAFNIVPQNAGTYIGRALLPTTRSGKVKIGQDVNINFNSFPNNEFGTVKGVVHNISLVATEVNNQSNYLIEISLPNGLYTTYKKELPFIPEMEGEAQIITKDISLLERFFMPLKKLLTDNV